MTIHADAVETAKKLLLVVVRPCEHASVELAVCLDCWIERSTPVLIQFNAKHAALVPLEVTGWICEEHPEFEWPHVVDGRDCPGPGMPDTNAMPALIYQRDRLRAIVRTLVSLRRSPADEAMVYSQHKAPVGDLPNSCRHGKIEHEFCIECGVETFGESAREVLEAIRVRRSPV